ncbi:MAG: ribosome maturation factor RimM [Candidatus Baltobacteraceae bacterium]
MTTKKKTKPARRSRTAANSATRPDDAIVIGRFVGTLGLRGELKVAGTRLAADALNVGTALILSFDAQRETAIVATVRHHAGKLVVTLEGAPDRTSAERFVGFAISVAREVVRLSPSEYLDVDLIGLQLVDEAGQVLGTAANVAHYPAQDCLVLAGSGALVPLVTAFVRKIDLTTKTIVVDLPPGLLDPAQAVDA